MLLIQDMLFHRESPAATLPLVNVTTTCRNGLSASCVSQVLPPVDDDNPVGMIVWTENNSLHRTGISDDRYTAAIKKENNKNKTSDLPTFGFQYRRDTVPVTSFSSSLLFVAKNSTLTSLCVCHCSCDHSTLDNERIYLEKLKLVCLTYTTFKTKFISCHPLHVSITFSRVIPSRI
jgi:hypothetical protein